MPHICFSYNPSLLFCPLLLLFSPLLSFPLLFSPPLSSPTRSSSLLCAPLSPCCILSSPPPLSANRTDHGHCYSPPGIMRCLSNNVSRRTQMGQGSHRLNPHTTRGPACFNEPAFTVWVFFLVALSALGAKRATVSAYVRSYG